MTEDDARRITERIRFTATTARESIEKLQRLVTQAQEGQAHLVLGYKSWTAYLAEVLGSEPLRLPRDQRQALVGYLAGEGMSVRAIAPIVGAAKSQVHRDIEQVSHLGHVNPETGEGMSTRAIATVTGTARNTVKADLRQVGQIDPPAPTVNTQTGEVSDDYPSTNVATGGEVTPAWGPYGTRVCAHCDELISQGRADEVVEELAARMTVRDAWHGVEPRGVAAPRARPHAAVAQGPGWTRWRGTVWWDTPPNAPTPRRVQPTPSSPPAPGRQAFVNPAQVVHYLGRGAPWRFTGLGVNHRGRSVGFRAGGCPVELRPGAGPV